MDDTGFEFEEHTADVQVRAWGDTLEQAYAQTALSLMHTISPNLDKIEQSASKDLEIISEDKQSLLFDFLSEFLYIFDVEGLIFSSIEVHKIEKIDDEFQINVTLKGEKFDREKHAIGTEVKAITYSFLTIKEGKDKVEIRIVFDI